MPSLDGRYAQIRTVWVPDADMKAEVEKVFSGKEPVVMNTGLTVWGGSNTQGVIAPMQDDELAFSGGTFSIDTEKNGHFNYGFNADRLSVKDTDMAEGDAAIPMVIQGLDLKSAGQMEASHIAFNSQTVFKVASMSKGAEGSVDGLTFTADTQRTGDDFAVNAGADIAKVSLPDSSASLRDMKNLSYHVSLSRLDAPAMEKIYRQVEQMKTTGSIDEAQLTQVVMGELPALLNRGPKFEFKPISFEAPAGKTVLNFSAELPAGQGAQMMSNPLLALDLLSMQGDLVMPKATLTAAMAESGQSADESQIDALVSEGYVSDDKGLLKTKFAFQKGHLTINDKPSDDLLHVLGALMPN